MVGALRKECEINHKLMTKKVNHFFFFFTGTHCIFLSANPKIKAIFLTKNVLYFAPFGKYLVFCKY